MGQTKLRLDKRRKLSDGTYPIQIVVGYGTDVYLKTDLYAKAEEWNAVSQQFTGRGARGVNSVLKVLLTNTINRVMELREKGMWKNLTRKELREMLTNTKLDKPTSSVPTLSTAFDAISVGRADKTVGMIQLAKRRVEVMGGNPDMIRLDEINYAWLEKYNTSMSDLSVNSRWSYTGIIRRAINWGLNNEYITTNPFRRFKVKKEETRMRVLTLEQFRRLLSLELSDEKDYEEVRDIFLLTFYLIGINPVDLMDCTHESVRNGRLEYRRHKTGKLYSIKLEPEALHIINKYKGKKKLLRMFEPTSKAESNLSYHRHTLKALGEYKLNKHGRRQYNRRRHPIMTPIEPDLSPYWARYSWATFAAELDIPKDTISEALGHSHGAAITGVYIKYNHDKVDEANRMVIDYVHERIKAAR